MANNILRDRIINSISKSPYKWRTARSIAKEIGENERDIADTIRESGYFVRANKANARGEPLYTTSKRYRDETPLLGRILGAAANTVSE